MHALRCLLGLALAFLGHALKVAPVAAPKWMRQAAIATTAALLLSCQPLMPPPAFAGIDAFEAAGKAFNDPMRKLKAPTGNDFQLVKEGKKELSTAPRASKRRALMLCKDGRVRQQASDRSSKVLLSEKDCINRVMDEDFQFVLAADSALKAAKK